MDNRSLYKYTFERLLNIVKESRYVIEKTHVEMRDQMVPLFSIGDPSYPIYEKLVKTNEHRANNEIEHLIEKLFERNGIAYQPYLPLKHIKSPAEYERWDNKPFQIVVNEEGEKTGYVFFTKNKGDLIEQFKKNDLPIDRLCFVRLENLVDTESSSDLIDFDNSWYKKSHLNIRCETICDFFCRFFGPEEFSVFMEYVNDFNQKANTIIGFNTVLKPTKTSIAKFKYRTEKALLNQRFDQEIDEIDSEVKDSFTSVKKVLDVNYFNNKRYLAMIGESDFANSFITSEWYFHIYEITESLDLTVIVAGYLKSIEQLLYAILNLPRNKGAYISVGEKKYHADGKSYTERSWQPYNEDTANIADTTLNALEDFYLFIKQNRNVCDIENDNAKKYIRGVLDNLRDKYRNKYFHKENLHDGKKVKEIRNIALYLYYLILGSCTISKLEYNQLGIESPSTVEISRLNYGQISNWLDNILAYDPPAKDSYVRINAIQTFNTPWEISIKIRSDYQSLDLDYLCSTSICDIESDTITWRSYCDNKTALEQISNLIKQYLSEGQFADSLKACSIIELNVSGTKSPDDMLGASMVLFSKQECV